MTKLYQDLRYGFRMLVKNPAFTAIAIITLALGIGANTAVFSVVNSMLFRPLPVKDAGQLVVLAFRQEHGELQKDFSYATCEDIRSQTSDVFSSVIGFQFGMDGLAVDNRAMHLWANYVPGDYFSTLGIQPALGRLILPSEGKTPGADPVLVLGYEYWESQFGADPNVVGKKVSVDGRPFTIVGVAPKGFHGLNSLIEAQGYIPFAMVSIEGGAADFMTNHSIRELMVLARLMPGVGLQQAQTRLDVVARRISEQYPDSEKGLALQALPELMARPQPDASGPLVAISALFLALAMVVLILACINVANILLVRASARQHEMAIRAALGAGRTRLMAQLLTESVLLSFFGGVAGILLGLWMSGMLGSIPLGTELPLRLDFGFDWRVFAFAFGAALLAGVLVGVIPALRASRQNLSDALHDGGRTISFGRHRLRAALVVAQVGGSLMLLIIAGLFTRSLEKAQERDLGFDPSHVLNITVDPNQIGYSEQQGRDLETRIVERARELPGVQSASLASAVPMGYYSNGSGLRIEGYAPRSGEPAPEALYNQISPEYFQTLRIPLVRGRSFTKGDDQESQYVAIINEAMADRFWPNQDPIGRRFAMSGKADQPLVVVGVARNARNNALAGSVRPYFYLPLEQHYNSLVTLHVRTDVDANTMAISLQREIAALAPGLPVFDVQPMKDALNTLNGFLMFKLGAGLAAILGMLGLALAVVGVYGVVSFVTSQRTHEIGIRMALGAHSGEIMRMVLGQGIVIVGCGVVAGLAAAAAAGQLVGGFLVGVSPTDPVTFIGVSVLMTSVALFASFVPAWRAAKVDPMVALRYE
jgi:putative ABC transport system permease protein